tara:strand:+ start:595 stop:753 length:159 start_codon:yes stop_codon:yes gene_type:complete
MFSYHPLGKKIVDSLFCLMLLLDFLDLAAENLFTTFAKSKYLGINPIVQIFN